MALIDFLSDRNVQVIDEGFKEKTSGTYWVVANLFGVRNTLIRFRGFCLDEKELANTRLKELILSLEVRNRIRKWLQALSLQNLPISTVRQLRKTTKETVQSYLQTQGGDFFQNLGQSIKWDEVSAIVVKRLQSSGVVNSSIEILSQEFALILERYLEKDLQKIVAEIIPILAIDQVIIDKVKGTSAEELEMAVQGIVKSELQGIVNLGGILGFIIGLLQIVILLVGKA